MSEVIHVAEIPVEVERKDIKHIHLSVYPPTGEVRISAPVHARLETVRLFAVGRLDWIRANRRAQRLQEREPEREYLDRESHYVWGRRYLLAVVEHEAAPSVTIDHSRLVLQVRAGAGAGTRQAVLSGWYRRQLREAADPLIEKWQIEMGVACNGLSIRKMKTRWGTCNSVRGTIRLNTELAKKHPKYLEYVIIHELAHLADPTHGKRFQGLLNEHLPNWPSIREQLNTSLLGSHEWLTWAS